MRNRQWWSRRHVCATVPALLLAAIALPIAGCHGSGAQNFPANYREYAYVTNGGNNTVTVFDVLNLRQDRVIPVGSNPTGVTANPKRNEIYVVNSGSGSVSVIDAEKKSVVATIPVQRRPYFISVNAEGTRGYVANAGSSSVSVLDLETHRQIAVIGVGESPGKAVLSPDGRTLVVSNFQGGSASIIDAAVPPAEMRVRSVFSGCPGATDIAILPDSSKAFVACSNGHRVMAIQLQSAPAAVAKGQPVRQDALLAMLDVGKAPAALALKPDGGEIFSINYGDGSISEINTSTNEVGGAYFIGTHPVRGLFAADDSTLYVSNFGADSLGIFSAQDGQLIPAQPRTGDGPEALAFSREGDLLFVVDARSGDIAVIRTSSNSLLTILPSGRNPSEIAVKAFTVKGHRL